MTTALPSELQSHRREQHESESHMNLHVDRSFLQRMCGTCITCEEQINVDEQYFDSSLESSSLILQINEIRQVKMGGTGLVLFLR